MKSIGIEIESTKAIFFALSRNGLALENVTGKFKHMEIDDIYNNGSIRNFQATIFSFFDLHSPNRIAIIKRNHKGVQASSPQSFKLEGLIQCYSKIEIEFIHPATIRSFINKNELPFEPAFSYQLKAAQLAFFLLVKL